MSDVDVAQSPGISAPDRPWLTLSQAADAAGVARTTIRRALDAGRFPQAKRDADLNGPGGGAWRVPVDDLLAAGFRLGRPAPPEQAQDSGTDGLAQTRGIAADQAEIAVLRAELAATRERAAVAEALAGERLRSLADMRRSLDGLQTALRALPAGGEQPRLSWRQRRRLTKAAKAAKAADVSPMQDVSR